MQQSWGGGSDSHRIVAVGAAVGGYLSDISGQSAWPMDEKIEALLKKAQVYLRSAAVLIELEDYDSTASRAYFAMFYAAQAALLHEAHAVSSTQGIRSAFMARFVEQGPLPARAGEVFARASDLQEIGDYASGFAVTESDAEFILAEAEAFVNSLERLVERSLV